MTEIEDWTRVSHRFWIFRAFKPQWCCRVSQVSRFIKLTVANSCRRVLSKFSFGFRFDRNGSTIITRFARPLATFQCANNRSSEHGFSEINYCQVYGACRDFRKFNKIRRPADRGKRSNEKILSLTRVCRVRNGEWLRSIILWVCE